ncbi:hypothetical protein Mmc1_2821 [Magnetococcus marinus MC-1]|uniref:Uncharacterized protein n=1 Tax=Magnetococcus marinus (strain ATCC BAA-1437 / JCM 17883 / MC-1) TaxID=156889 RepID=A0LB99_MAGMM|nr:hypothetical protein [Magnetococcus marinus]ABK45242.1 hypothetical protein Mmc1_2749 [Magnetococcus marinus MC-1]ABK45314.1 hypothetical protein Mmc1_2821 [Magnetococcus marinus MC-1]
MNEKLNHEQRLEAFAKELAELTRKYGVAVSVTGGVIIDQPEAFEEIEYFTANEGDLLPHIGDNWL